MKGKSLFGAVWLLILKCFSDLPPGALPPPPPVSPITYQPRVLRSRPTSKYLHLLALYSDGVSVIREMWQTTWQGVRGCPASLLWLAIQSRNLTWVLIRKTVGVDSFVRKYECKLPPPGNSNHIAITSQWWPPPHPQASRFTGSEAVDH